MRKIMISATTSSTGKTTISCGLMRALKNRGMDVQPFKVGPDYIDTEYHARACGNKSRNLDEFMLPQDEIKYIFGKNSEDKDVSIVEGVMGLYDGYGASKDYCSSASISKLISCPVILVIDAKSMAASSAALVYGFKNIDLDVEIAGVIVNNVNTESHYNILKQSIEEYTGVPVLGRIPKDDDFGLSSRHLGLTPSFEVEELENKFDYVASRLEEYLDIDRILQISECNQNEYDKDKRRDIKGITKIKLGLAYDKAFNFYYQDNLDLLEEMGVELVKFSPLYDEKLPECQGIYIGGGFPEVFAKELSYNESLLNEINEKSSQGMPIYAECGGLMYLGDQVEDLDGNFYHMTGIFEGVSKMQTKLQRFGYCSGKANENTVISKKGQIVKGHEFHYSTFESSMENAYEMYKKMSNGQEKFWSGGFASGNTLGTYLHTHFCGDYDIAKNFIQNMELYKKQVKDGR
ncbi:MAG: cobyrinate a,c-diamide synthase [Proteocatella sp.]